MVTSLVTIGFPKLLGQRNRPGCFLKLSHSNTSPYSSRKNHSWIAWKNLIWWSWIPTHLGISTSQIKTQQKVEYILTTLQSSRIKLNQVHHQVFNMCHNRFFRTKQKPILKPSLRIQWTVSSCCSQISFNHIWREANFVADAIAKAGYSVSASFWDKGLPLIVANYYALHQYQLRCGCARGFSV